MRKRKITMAPLQTATNTEIQDILTENETPIQKFYHDKTIFLTGGTGFFGKIIMEKLLRVTNLEHIYLLVRMKKGKDIYTRIDEIFEDPIFDLIKRDHPKFRHKISGICGDCSLPGLGISPEERSTLQQKVQIVIHGAATVRFDEKLKIALAINVSGTKEVIALCKEIFNLQAVVHVSTAFANCNYSNIDEKFYNMKLSGENACHLSECLDEDTMDNITNELIKGYPNTYTYTKALAEDIIKSSGKGLPIAVFRPGIVITTYKEPIAGWIDNMYGPSGIIIGVGAGILRVFHGQIKNTAHVVPVDMSVNALLASGWDVANNRYDEPPIYNYIPDNDNPVIWKTYLDLGSKFGSRVPITRSIWYQTLTVTPSKLLFSLLTFFYHTIPAFLMDAGLLLTGKKPRMMQIYKKVHKFCNVMTYFSNNKWTFTNYNTRTLWSKLTDEDQKIFFFDMRQVNWTNLIESSLIGIRTFVVKDDPKTIPAAMKRFKRFKILHYSLLYLIYSIGLILMYVLVSKVFLQ